MVRISHLEKRGVKFLKLNNPMTIVPSKKCIVGGSKYVHWIGLYLSFHLSWILGPFVHGRLQNLQTSEDTF